MKFIGTEIEPDDFLSLLNSFVTSSWQAKVLFTIVRNSITTVLGDIRWRTFGERYWAIAAILNG